MDKTLSYKGFNLETTSGVSYLILFIIWPFLAFLLALLNYTRREAKAVVFFFLVYFGLTFVSDNQLMDSYRYVETWKFYASLPFKDIFRAISGYYFYSASLDFVEPMLAFLISRLTENYHVFFAAFAALFAFFYLRAFNLLYDEYKEKPNLNSWVFMAFSLVIIPITNLSVLRMWIAAWIFFYGAYLLLRSHKAKYLLLALSACLVHWSFLTVSILLIGYFFAGNRRLIYTPIAIASFFISQFLNPILDFVSTSFTGSIGERVEGYTSESHALIYQDWLASNSWFLGLSQDLIWYFFIIAIIVIRVFKRELMKSKFHENWYNFLLILFTLVNLGRRIPDFGMRMQSVFILFATAYVFFYFNSLGERKLKLMTILGLFPILLFTVVQFRIGADSMNAWLFAPGFGLPLLDPGLSLSELLFGS